MRLNVNQGWKNRYILCKIGGDIRRLSEQSHDSGNQVRLFGYTRILKEDSKPISVWDSSKQSI